MSKLQKNRMSGEGGLHKECSKLETSNKALWWAIFMGLVRDTSILPSQNYSQWFYFHVFFGTILMAR